MNLKFVKWFAILAIFFQVNGLFAQGKTTTIDTLRNEAEKNRNNHVIVGNDSAYVDWTVQYVVVKGTSFIDSAKWKPYGRAVSMAVRGAELICYRKLLETIKGVRVIGETTVENMMTKSDYVYSRVDGIIKGAEQVGEVEFGAHGQVTVTMRVPIYRRNGLAEAVSDGTQERQQNTNVQSAQQVIMRVTNQQGQQVNPPIFPKVTDENGNVLLDLAKSYDPKNPGKFPSMVKLGKAALQKSGQGKAVQVIDAVLGKDGNLQVNSQQDGGSGNGSTWLKVLGTVADIGKYLLLLL